MIIIVAREGTKETRISTDFLGKMFRNVFCYLMNFYPEQDDFIFSGKYFLNDLYRTGHSENELFNFSA